MKSLSSGAAYLRAQQSAEGTFDANPGVSAVAAAALLRQPGVPKDMLMDAGGKRALDAIVKLAKPDGGIYDKIDPALHHRGQRHGARRRRPSAGQAAHRKGPRAISPSTSG